LAPHCNLEVIYLFVFLIFLILNVTRIDSYHLPSGTGMVYWIFLLLAFRFQVIIIEITAHIPKT
jgi:hypothetical protein